MTRRSQNFLVWVHLHDAAGIEFVGVGEGQPRGALTGDSMAASWDFLGTAADSLVDVVLDTADPTAAVESVRDTMSMLRTLADDHAEPGLGAQPYRGTLLGIEVALLDAVSQALGLALHELLGTHRSEVFVSSDTLSTVSGANLDDEFRRKVRNRAERFGAVRIKGFGDVERDLRLLRAVGDQLGEMSRDNILWIDQNCGLSDGEADHFVDEVAKSMCDGALPRKVIIEQPVGASSDRLPDLQRRADRAVAEHGDLRIMPDESIASAADFDRVVGADGCRAINIKAPKAGGLLASLELAKTAAGKSDVEVYIGGMLGTSDITSWTLVHLGMALERLDYLSAVLPAQVERRIASPRAGYEPGTRQLRSPRGTGLGAVVDRAAILPYIAHEVWSPRGPAFTLRGELPNDYSDAADKLRGFDPIAMDSHVLEREALLRGLGSRRYSIKDVTFNDPADRSAAFCWSRSPLTSRAAAAMTIDKEASRRLLSRAGVPTPRGRVFPLGSAPEAAEYAATIGFPVVVKPVAGTAGIGVMTDLRNRAEVEEAFATIRPGPATAQGLIVESHVRGDSYRIFVLDDEVISAIRWRGAELTGDGQLTVGELAALRNDVRRTNPHLLNRLVKLNRAARRALERQGLDIESVPRAGEVVQLAPNPQGGDTEEVLDQLHPSIHQAAVRAVAAIPGLGYSGLDVILEDPRVAIDDQSAAVLELNASPALTSAEYPVHGPRHPTVGRIVEAAIAHGGLVARPRSEDSITASLEVHGYLNGDAYGRWLSRRADELGVTVSLEECSGRLVRSRIAGAAVDLAIVASEAIVGPNGSSPTRVSTQPIGAQR
ncbi:enolase C-terminal domain-like protein [Ilumatobacter nonamiensis]|uniref:enolase C-terminal domain-like protein n=1 Tax=Ilumatobacter nonamiensis TaxID=467093 RepID=UPI000344DC44|nr:enolase C-terminal domain-like protein [Ilumatobacter nonamiensis]